jgi:hypothetical protein
MLRPSFRESAPPTAAPRSLIEGVVPAVAWHIMPKPSVGRSAWRPAAL